jgi:hypothetical protein
MRLRLIASLAALALAWLCAQAFAEGGAKPPRRRPSPVIFGPQYIPLAFDHKVHVSDNGVPCEACHEKALGSERSVDRLTPTKEGCGSCHAAGRNASREEQLKTCQICHPGYEPIWPEGVAGSDTAKVTNPPPAIVLPRPNLKMNHAAHVEAQIACLACHIGVDKVELATRENALPLMATCLTCHDGRRASKRCATCHLAVPTGRLRLDFPAGKLRPSGRYYGDAHDARFVKDHASLARARRPYCESCHSRKDCSDCHTGYLRPGRVHPSNWSLVHPVRARGNELDCSSCHRLQSFCADCHVRSGVVSSGPAAFDRSKGSFHSAGWIDPGPGRRGQPRSPEHHAYQAQRNIRTCVSCHTESDCIACHAAGTLNRLGSPVSPHPSGFKEACAPRKRSNETMCQKCHAPADPLLRLCE